jgi:hypothetical protein
MAERNKLKTPVTVMTISPAESPLPLLLFVLLVEDTVFDGDGVAGEERNVVIVLVEVSV